MHFKVERSFVIFAPFPGILTLFRRVCSAFLITLRGAAMLQHTELAKCEVCTFDASIVRSSVSSDLPVRSGHLPRGTLSPKGACNYNIPLERLLSFNVKYLGHDDISRKILHICVKTVSLNFLIDNFFGNESIHANLISCFSFLCCREMP